MILATDFLECERLPSVVPRSPGLKASSVIPPPQHWIDFYSWGV